MGEQHRYIIDRSKTFACQLIHECLGNPHGSHAEGGLADFIARQLRPAPFAQDDKEFAESELVRRDNGAMHLDLIGLRWNGKTIRKFDVWDNEAILLREFASHFRHTAC